MPRQPPTTRPLDRTNKEIVEKMGRMGYHERRFGSGLLTQGVLGVPHPFAPRRRPLGPSPDRKIAIGHADTLVPGPLARM
jgi:hypothetical protein